MVYFLRNLGVKEQKSFVKPWVIPVFSIEHLSYMKVRAIVIRLQIVPAVVIHTYMYVISIYTETKCIKFHIFYIYSEVRPVHVLVINTKK